VRLDRYPPEKVESAAAVDFLALEAGFQEIQRLTDESGICLLVGSVTGTGGVFQNSAVLFRPGGRAGEEIYNKRALWGWDLENFAPGSCGGVWEIDGFRFGARICYEVRFPEYFRELYREKVDFAVVLFCYVSKADDADLYELIRSHVRTRASELTCPVLSVNDISPFQAAPTGVYDGDGYPVRELERGREGLLIFDFERSKPTFSGRGRRTIADRLTGAGENV
jgi:predicted amidohydrolase